MVSFRTHTEPLAAMSWFFSLGQSPSWSRSASRYLSCTLISVRITSAHGAWLQIYLLVDDRELAREHAAGVEVGGVRLERPVGKTGGNPQSVQMRARHELESCNRETTGVLPTRYVIIIYQTCGGRAHSLLPRICAVDAVGMGATSSELRTPCSAMSARSLAQSCVLCHKSYANLSAA